MKSFNEIPKYCISLYSTPNRLRGFLEEAQRVNLQNYKIYYGLHPSMTAKIESKATASLPAILLSLNHYSLWNMIAMKDTEDFFMVMEDDAIFNAPFDKMDYYLSKIPAEAEFVSWGASRPEGWSEVEWDFVKFNPIKVFPCTHAYMLTPKCAKKIISFCNEIDMSDTVDLLLNGYVYPKIDVYLAGLPIIGQKSVAFTLPIEKRDSAIETLLK